MSSASSEKSYDLHVEAFEGQGLIPASLADAISKALLRIPGVATVGIAQEKTRR